MYDAEKYRDKAEVEEWKRRDPIELLVARMTDAGIYDEGERAAIEAEVKADIDRAVADAEAAPLEPVSDLTKDVYTEATR
jgi:pyruvate dehydrogenase E1 component alpha subunit